MTITPEQKAEVLFQQIYHLITQESPEPKGQNNEAAQAEIVQLYNETLHFLEKQGYEELVGKIQGDNRNYVNSLFIWSFAGRVIDHLPRQGGYETTQKPIDECMRDIIRKNRSIALKEPTVDDYCKDLLPPYQNLAAVWFVLDRQIQNSRYATMLQAANKLMDL